MTPLEEPTAYVVTGWFDRKCGFPTPCCAAQLSRETQVVMGLTGICLGATGGCHSSALPDGAIGGVTGAISLTGCGSNGLCTTLVLTQLNDGDWLSADGRAAPTTQKNTTAKIIPANLITPLLWAMRKPTQAVSNKS